MNEIWLDQLYCLDSSGGIKQWQAGYRVNNDGTAVLISKAGKLNGTLTQHEKDIKTGKNIGKANETSSEEQACFEAEAKHKKKCDEGYCTSIAEAKDKEILLPMLAHSYTKRGHDIVFPCAGQPKLNGVRCLAKKVSDTRIDYTSRKGKSFNGTLGHLTPHLLPVMSIGEIFDGEIYVHGWSFQRIIRAVKKHRGPGSDTLKLQYHLYDIVNPEVSFKQRGQKLFTAIGYFSQNSILVNVKTMSVSDKEAVKKNHDRFVQQGYEGIILRNLEAGYSIKHRSKDLQKYKEFIDSEFIIIGGLEEQGNSAGCIVFTVSDPDNPKVVFNVRPKGTVEYRRELFRNRESLLGKELTVRYQEKSEDGVPIFPVGIAIRDYE